MGTTAPAAPAISIDIEKDLEAFSDLRKLISADSNVILQLAPALTRHAGQPVSAAVGASLPNLTLATSPEWTAGPVTFSLAPEAKCRITIAAKGEALNVATRVDDPATTTDVQLAADPAMTYINIDLDFSLEGNVSGNGTVYGLTISGKTSESQTTTLSFCQPVPSGTETVAALKMAFSRLVFPTGPDAVARMLPGSSCRMSFDGALNWELDLSYGLADYKLSAPSASLVQDSVAKVVPETLALPSPEMAAGINASVTYTHTDYFGLVILKQDANTALLHLVRSASEESGVSGGITAGVTLAAISAKVDPTQIQQTVRDVTGSAKLAASVAEKVIPQIDKLESAALTKLNAWMANGNGDAGLSVALSRQTGRTALFSYKVDLTQPAVAAQSWDSLLTRNIQDPANMGGFTLLSGSGVGEQFKKATTLQFHFFNLYRYSGVAGFFDNCSTELAADGTIEIIYDVGIEAVVTNNQAVDRVRFHFSATANEAARVNVSNAEIDMIIDISEKGDPKGAAVLANLLGMVDKASLQSTVDAMSAYAASHPTGTLGLVAVLKPSGYGRLSYSPYAGGKPQGDQSRDETNWKAIHEATIGLMGRNFEFLAPFTYNDWCIWNVYCNNGGPGPLPDRRHSGPDTAVPATLWKGNAPAMVDYFFRAIAGGMNLFEDSATLARASETTEAQWQSVKAYVTRIVQGDANVDYAKPIAAAILSQAAAQSSGQTVSTVQTKDAGAFTTTFTVA